MIQAPILIFSSVVWNFYKTRPQEIAYALSKRGSSVVYVEPLVYVAATSTRLQNVSNNAEDSVQVVRRHTRLHKGAALLIYENLKNMWIVMRTHPRAVIAGDIWMSAGVALWCRVFGIRFVFDNMDYWPAVEKSPLLRAIIRRFLYPFFGRVSYAVLNTSHFLQKYMAQYSERSVYIPNAKSVEDIAAQDSLSERAVGSSVYHRVVFIATLRDWYDYSLLIRVFAKLPQIQLDIFGDGPMREKIIQEAGSYPNITVHGPIQSIEIAEHIAHSDFGVLPLRAIEVTQGVFPIKLLDYWSARKAVIGTPIGELNDLVKEGGLVLANTVDTWVDTVQEWYREPEEAADIGSVGYQRLRSEFQYDILITQIEDLINTA